MTTAFFKLSANPGSVQAPQGTGAAVEGGVQGRAGWDPDALYTSLDLKHSVYDESGDSGTIDPNSGMRVRNPVKPKKGRGRSAQKRKMGARG